MKDIYHMMKSRALFFESISYVSGEPLVLDDNFMELLRAFINKYLSTYFKTFNLILYFKETDDGYLKVYEDDNWEEIFMKYKDIFNRWDDREIANLYKEIGYDNVDLISRLAEQFVEFKWELDNLPYTKIKQ